VTSRGEVPSWIPVGGRGSRRDGIVLQHLTLVKAMAARIHRDLPIAVDLDDLFQAGVVGLLDAVETYDGSENEAFDSHAKRRIKGTILDSLRQLDGAPRCVRQQPERLDPMARDAAMSLGRGQPDSETGDREVSVHRPACVPMRLKTVSAGRGFTHRRREGHAAPDVAAGPESQPDRICERNELRHTLDRAIERLPNRYRKVLILSYGNDMTIKRISGLLGVSESRISQIRRKALQKMSAELQAGGFPLREHFTMGRIRMRPARGQI
jgi:RNA polymerase sigma factor for flagellar operon FliA